MLNVVLLLYIPKTTSDVIAVFSGNTVKVKNIQNFPCVLINHTGFKK